MFLWLLYKNKYIFVNGVTAKLGLVIFYPCLDFIDITRILKFCKWNQELIGSQLWISITTPPAPHPLEHSGSIIRKTRTLKILGDQFFLLFLHFRNISGSFETLIIEVGHKGSLPDPKTLSKCPKTVWGNTGSPLFSTCCNSTNWFSVKSSKPWTNMLNEAPYKNFNF